MPQSLNSQVAHSIIFGPWKLPYSHPAKLQVLCSFVVYCLILPVFEWRMYLPLIRPMNFRISHKNFRISHKPGSSRYILKCRLPSPQGCFTWPSLQVILYTPGAVLLDRTQWMHWEIPLNPWYGPQKHCIPVEFMLDWRWMKTEVIIQPDRRVHKALGTSLILKGVSYVSRAGILSL